MSQNFVHYILRTGHILADPFKPHILYYLCKTVKKFILMESWKINKLHSNKEKIMLNEQME